MSRLSPIRFRRLAFFLGGLLSAGSLVAAIACGEEAPQAAPTSIPTATSIPAATPTQVPTQPPPTSTPAPTATPTPAPTATAVPTQPAPTATAAPAAVEIKVARHATLGPVLTDASGRVLYLFTKDELGKSNCSGGCATAWPPLVTAGMPAAGDGVAAARIATTQRSDGSMQVTYDGWPLYYFAKDAASGDATGQNVNGVWFVVSPLGGPVQTSAAVKLSIEGKLAPRLVDASGRTLYLFAKDVVSQSTCSGNCALSWPPLLTVNAAVAGEGVTADRLATIERADGGKQVTYNGMPLYYYAKDERPGATTGQDVGKVWFVVSPFGRPLFSKALVKAEDRQGTGMVLADPSGRSLYVFTKDAAGASTCSGNCALNWPPVLTSDPPEAGEGANAAMLGTIKRADGSTQVTYNGMPLYYYAKDAKPGDATGQGVGGVWFLVGAGGNVIK